MEYEDDPNANLEFLKSLNKAEIRLYVKGYVMSCVHTREALSTLRYEILSHLLEKENEQLEFMVKGIDHIEGLISKKEHTLLERFPEISVPR